MVDLNGHEAGNGGHSQGKPTAHRDSSTRREAMLRQQPHSSRFVHNLNGQDISADHGAPLRLRLARQLGYKCVKFFSRITVSALR